MTKTASLFFGESFIKLTSEINAGLSILDINYDPIILDIGCSDAELSQAIKQVLAQSIVIEDGDQRVIFCQEALLNSDIMDNKIDEIDKKIMQKYGYKTKKKYEKDLMSLCLSLSLDKYKFKPYHTYSNGFSGLDESISLSLSATDEEIAIAARKAMALCTSAYK